MEALSPFRPGVHGPFDFQRANRLFSRLGFGAPRDEVEAAVEHGLDALVARLFEQRDAPGSDERAANGLRSGAVADARAWWLGELHSGASMARERMALFWHGHFATSVRKPLPLALLVRQIELFRRRGLGRFDELLLDVARDPAMLLWLDANQSTVADPNENLAREILELFALGHGAYSQRDIRELARALTGWDVDIDRAVFRDARHDAGPKSVLGSAALHSAEEALRVVGASPLCARFVAGRIWSHFFGAPPNPDELEHLARGFLSDDLHLGRLVERIVRSRAFLEPQTLAPRIAAPVELVTVFARRLGVAPDPKRWASVAEEMGQALLAPPSVAGWPQGRSWFASSWCLRRAELAARLLHGAHESNAPSNIPSNAAGVDLVRQLFCVDDSQRDVVQKAASRLSGAAPTRSLATLLSLPETQTL
jgi:uncharacterized protein (DUF1800 family)